MAGKRDLDPGASPLHFFGAEVRRAREAAGMTLAELGARVPCDASTVSRVESGLLSPSAGGSRCWCRACSSYSLASTRAADTQVGVRPGLLEQLAGLDQRRPFGPICFVFWSLLVDLDW